jgi:hypothetical protein
LLDQEKAVVCDNVVCDICLPHQAVLDDTKAKVTAEVHSELSPEHLRPLSIAEKKDGDKQFPQPSPCLHSSSFPQTQPPLSIICQKPTRKAGFIKGLARLALDGADVFKRSRACQMRHV